MSIKIIGAILVIAGCGGFGFKLASNHIREERSLRRFTSVLDYMECELRYRMTPLPILCHQAAEESSGAVFRVLNDLSRELEEQLSPNVEQCMHAVLSRTGDIPVLTKQAFELLGRSLGRFDIDGQLKELDMVRQECRRNLETLAQNRDVRLRSYQTLGLCAGAALAILFI